MDNFTDIQLVELIRGSDEGALKQLYRRHWKLLYHISLQKTGNAADAEDIVQELFMDLWDRRGQLAIRASLRSYLISCVYYKVFTYFRNKGVKERHLNDFATFLQSSGHHSGQIDLYFSARESEYKKMMEIIEDAIQMMPARMKQIFLHSYTSRKSISEIAQEFRISPHTVKKQLSYAMSKLRKEAQKLPLDLPVLLFIAGILLCSH